MLKYVSHILVCKSEKYKIILFIQGLLYVGYQVKNSTYIISFHPKNSTYIISFNPHTSSKKCIISLAKE